MHSIGHLEKWKKKIEKKCDYCWKVCKCVIFAQKCEKWQYSKLKYKQLRFFLTKNDRKSVIFIDLNKTIPAHHF